MKTNRGYRVGKQSRLFVGRTDRFYSELSDKDIDKLLTIGHTNWFEGEYLTPDGRCVYTFLIESFSMPVVIVERTQDEYEFYPFGMWGRKHDFKALQLFRQRFQYPYFYNKRSFSANKYSLPTPYVYPEDVLKLRKLLHEIQAYLHLDTGLFTKFRLFTTNEQVSNRNKIHCVQKK